MFLKHNPPVTFGVWTSAMDAQHPLTLSRFWKRRISMLQSPASPPSRLRLWTSGVGSLLLAGVIVSLPFIHLTRETPALASDKPAVDKPTEKEALPTKTVVPSASASEKPELNVKRSGVFLQEVQVKGKSQTVPVTESQPVSVGADDHIVPIRVETMDVDGNKSVTYQLQLQSKNRTVSLSGNTLTNTAPKAESFPVPSPLDQKIIDALDKPLAFPLNLQEESVHNALEIIGNRSNLKFSQDKKALDEQSISLDTLTVVANYEGATLRQALEVILEPNDLSYQIKAGTLQITTKSGATRQIYLYPARDLAQTNDELQSLVSTLFMTPILREQAQSKREHEQPNDDASVNVLAGTILIRHSFQSHLEVLDLLRTLRSAAAMTQAANLPTYPVTSPTPRAYYPPEETVPPHKRAPAVVALPGIPATVKPVVVSPEASQWKTVDPLTSKPKKLMYLDVVDDQVEMLKLVKAYVRNHGRYPKDLNEFNKEVLEKAGYQLIELEPGFHYEYRKADHLPGIVQNPKAPTNDPVAEATKKKEDPTYLDLTVADDGAILKGLISNFAKRHGRYPKDLKECESEVLEKSHYKLMKLEDGKTYEYLKDDRLIAIRRPPAKDKTEASPPATSSPEKK